MRTQHETVIRPIHVFDGTRDALSPRDRLNAIKRQARIFREQMLCGEKVVYYKSFDLVRVPYPSAYALCNAYRGPSKYVHILNRMIVVQFKSADGIKTMLVSPSDVQRNRETPYFKRLGRRRLLPESLFAPVLGTVEGALQSIGLKPEDIDYITYDHLHTQDVRRWLVEGYFPNAKLLVTRQEWVSAAHPLPPQMDWYCPNGIDGVPGERIVLLDSDVLLGEGVALVRTPGHTEGNHSIVAHTEEGLLVTSENGVGADAYAPEHSRIPGLRKFARDTGMDVVLNGNTLERGLDQYLSMVLEKEIAGPSKPNPEFYNVYPSSELTGYWMFPWTAPTFSFGTLEFGKLHVK